MGVKNSALEAATDKYFVEWFEYYFGRATLNNPVLKAVADALVKSRESLGRTAGEPNGQ